MSNFGVVLKIYTASQKTENTAFLAVCVICILLLTLSGEFDYFSAVDMGMVRVAAY